MVTGESASKAAAIIGKAAFLEPLILYKKKLVVDNKKDSSSRNYFKNCSMVEYYCCNLSKFLKVSNLLAAAVVGGRHV